MTIDSTTLIGFFAAACTTFSFLPQVIRVWRTGEVEQLALGTFLLLTLGTVTWLIYGILDRDPAVIAANLVTCVLVSYILFVKVRSVLRRSSARQVLK